MTARENEETPRVTPRKHGERNARITNCRARIVQGKCKVTDEGTHETHGRHTEMFSGNTRTHREYTGNTWGNVIPFRSVPFIRHAFEFFSVFRFGFRLKLGLALDEGGTRKRTRNAPCNARGSLWGVGVGD